MVANAHAINSSVQCGASQAFCPSLPMSPVHAQTATHSDLECTPTGPRADPDRAAALRSAAALFVAKNYMADAQQHLRFSRVPLLFGVWGARGSGKTFGVELCCKVGGPPRPAPPRPAPLTRLWLPDWLPELLTEWCSERLPEWLVFFAWLSGAA